MGESHQDLRQGALHRSICHLLPSLRQRQIILLAMTRVRKQAIPMAGRSTESSQQPHDH